jgi:hypothetical protein
MTRSELNHLSRWPPAQRAAKGMFVPDNRTWDNDRFECRCNRRRIETIGVQKHLHFPVGQKRALTGWARAWGCRIRILRLSRPATVNNERLIESPAQKTGSSEQRSQPMPVPIPIPSSTIAIARIRSKKNPSLPSRPSPQGRFGAEAPENTRTCFLTRFFQAPFHPRAMVDCTCSNSF